MFRTMFTGAWFLGCAFAVLTGPLHAETVVEVASAAALTNALGTAAPGTVLQLTGDDYGALILTDLNGADGAPITLRSADPAHPAQFSAMHLRGVSHLVLQGLSFDYRFSPEDAANFRPFDITGAQDITLTGNLFDGDVATGVSAEDDDKPTGFGLALRGVTKAMLDGNEIRNFYRGLIFSESTDVTVRGNDVHDIRMDGMDFAQMDRVLIEGNHIHDFKRVLASTDHADMIQFWTNGTKTPSSDITIRGNILNSGAGLYTQSIFMRNDQVDTGKAGPEMFYRRVVIEENVIINAHLHGITVGETADLMIRNNSVIRNAASQGPEDNPALWTPQIRVAPTSTKVTVIKNVVSKVAGYDTQPDWTVADNFAIQDRNPSQPGFYDQVFVAARSGDPTNLASFAYLPGGPLDGAGIGAALLDASRNALPNSDVARPVIRVVSDATYSNRFSFDAGSSSLPEGVAPDKIGYTWDLGDGNTATGPLVDHVYAKTGPLQVVLTLTLPDGSLAATKSSISVPGPDVLIFSSETGTFTSFAGRNPVTPPGLAPSAGPVVLGQGTAPIVLDPDLIAPFFQASDFTLSLKIRGVGGYRAAGELLRIHQSLVVTVTERGTLDVRFDTGTAKQLKISTSPTKLFSGEWREIGFNYSAKTGLFTVTADGHIIGRGKTFGQIKPLEHWGLALGNPFANRKSFDGEMESLSLRANEEGFIAAN